MTENWEAVDAQSQKSESRFYLNVCHKVLHTGGAAGCPVNASICAVGKSPSDACTFFPLCYSLPFRVASSFELIQRHPHDYVALSASRNFCRLCLASDKNNNAISLGSFLASPQTLPGNDIRLVYTEGSFCVGKKTKIQTILTLKCKPGGPREEQVSLPALSVAAPVSLVCSAALSQETCRALRSCAASRPTAACTSWSGTRPPPASCPRRRGTSARWRTLRPVRLRGLASGASL